MHEILPCLTGKVSRKCFGVLFFLAFLLAGNYGYSQVGTTCENPIVVSALPYTTTDDTANYADNYDPSEDSDPECETTTSGNSYHKGNDVIYSYTPATDSSIDIEMPDGVAWSGMFVYADCADIGLVYAACATSTSSGDRIINDFPVVGGQTYYILLSIWATPQTYAYTLNITENTCTEHTVVFDIVADCENGDQFMVAANVTDMGTATSITFTDDQGSASQQLSATGTVTFGPYENLTEVVITAANSGDGNCVVVSDELTQTNCPPANDECAGAIALTVNPDYSCAAVASATTLGATESMESDPCNGNPDDDVWFSFEATAEEHLITLSNIDAVTGTSEDMYYEVLSGTCGTLENVYCTDSDSDTVEGLTIGETYYVRVYSYYATARQTFDICVGTAPGAPANDDCLGAIALTVNDDLECTTVTQGTTGGATESMAAAPCNGTPDDDVWFSFEATQSSHYIKLDDIEAVVGTSTDMYFQVLSGACGTEMASIICSDSNSAFVNGFTAGETYYVRVYNYGSSARNNFSICVGTPPAAPTNDECANAVALTVNPDQECGTVTEATTLGATQSMAAGECGGSPNDDVWFSFEAEAASHEITISDVTAVAGDTSTDMYFQVLSGACGTEMESLECSDPNTAVITGLTAGETYYVRVYSFYTTTMQDFSICVGTLPPPPANDECANAVALPVGEDFESAAVVTNNASATNNAADPLPGCDAYNFATNGKDVWFTVVVPASGSVILETGSNDDDNIDDTGIAAYSGTCGSLTALGCNGDKDDDYFSLLELTGLTPGETLLVRAWGYDTNAGSFKIAAYDTCNAAAPVGNEEQTLEPGQTLADLDVTGEELTWYSDEALTTEIPATTVAVDGSVYYVTQVVDECISTALAVTVAVVDPCAGILAPEAAEEQTLEPGQTLADLEVTGEELTWYSDEELTTEIPDTTVAVDGATYYVTQTVGECTSTATDITVAVVDPCAGILAPEAAEEQTLEPGQTLADLDVTGESLTWYSDEALTTEIPDTTVAVDGATYYVTQTVGECTSAATVITVAVVDPCAGVLAPAGNEEQQFNTGETLADLDVTGENLTWYADEALTTELPATTVLVNDTTYYVTQTVGECVSAALPVTVSEILGTEGLDKASFRYYPNPAADVLTLSYAEEITNVTVYNMLGQPVISTALNATEGTVDVSRLASGNYLVKVEAGNAATTVKIVKN